MERIIEIAVRGLNAVQTNDMEYVCDNTDYIAEFDFDEEWDGVDPKTARFVYGGEHQDIVFTGNRCEIPRISDVNSMRVGVFAGNLVTTTPAQVICRKSILGKSGLPADPAPDVYAQIMEVAFPAAVAEAEESARQAAASEQTAKISETNAEESARNAAQSASDAKTSADEAFAERTEARRLVDVCAAYSKSANNSASYASDAKTEIQKSEQNIIDAAGIATASAAVSAQSEQNAKTAENNAKASEQNAAASAESAAQTLQSIDVSKESAAASAAAAAQSAQAAKTSESNASASAQAAKTSEGNAKASETNAAQSATEAKQAAESVNLPTPTPETAGKAVIVNEDGTGFELGEAPSSGGGSGATSWEELGSEFENATLIPETIIDCPSGEGALPDVYSLTIGNTYTVNWNGTAYNCTARDVSDIGMAGAVVLGDVDVVTSGSPVSGEPFIILFLSANSAASEGFGVGIVPLDGSENPVVSVTYIKETITLVPEKYIPNQDWNANDGESGHILNRTHYAEIVAVDFSTENVMAMDGAILQPIPVQEGCTYTVTWNGVEYECTAFAYMGILLLGDVGLLHGTTVTGEPFVIFIYEEPEDGKYAHAYPKESASEISLTIRGAGERVHKLDAKFVDFDLMASMDAVDFSVNGAVVIDIGSHTSVQREAETFREQLRKGFIKVKFALEYIKNGASAVSTVETFTMPLLATGESHAFGMVQPTDSDLLCFVSLKVISQIAYLNVWPGFTRNMLNNEISTGFKAPVICDKNGNYYGLMVNDSGNLQAYSLGEI